MIFRALIWRHLRGDIVRTLLSLAAVALGVAVVIAIRLANRSAIGSFAADTGALAGGADLIATGPAPIPLSTLAQLRSLAAEADILPYIDRRVLDQRAHDSLELFGEDLIAGAGHAGAPPLTSSVGDSAQVAIALAADYARRHQLRAGDSLTLTLDGRERVLRIASILPAQGVASVAPPDLAVMDLGAALALLAPGAPPSFDGLRLRLAPGTNVAVIAAAVNAALPVPDRVTTPAARTGDYGRMLAAFRANLTALSYVSLLVGVLLIYNTVSISVVRRRTAIGIVRALGVTPRAVLRLFLGEGIAIALAGGILGIAAGRGLAVGAVQLVGLTVNNLYASVGTLPPTLNASDFALGIVVALLAGVMAAWAPARQAALLPPADALRPGAQEYRLRRRAGALLVWSAGCALLALALALWRPETAVPWTGFGCALSALAAFALLAPALLSWLLPPLRAALLRRGQAMTGLAAGGLAAALRRSSVLTVALATALGVMFGVAIMVGSFRQTVAVWIGQQLRADVFVRSADWSREQPVSLDAAALADVAATPGIAAIGASRSLPWTLRGQPVTLNLRWWIVSPPDLSTPLPGYRFLARGFPGSNPQPALAAGAVLISEPLARRLRLWSGDTLDLATPAGPAHLPIAGVFYDYTSGRGTVLLSPALYRRWFAPGPLRPTELELYARPAVGSAALRRNLELRLPATLAVTDNATLRAEIMRIFDQTFRITWALEAIALVVALLGVGNTLLAVVLDRRREFAILRLLGATPAQARQLLVAEAGLVGLLALALGLALSGVLALILLRVINVESFGWTIQWHPPYAFVLESALAVWLATLVAGWLPARAALRQSPLAAVAAE